MVVVVVVAIAVAVVVVAGDGGKRAPRFALSSMLMPVVVGAAVAAGGRAPVAVAGAKRARLC